MGRSGGRWGRRAAAARLGQSGQHGLAGAKAPQGLRACGAAVTMGTGGPGFPKPTEELEGRVGLPSPGLLGTLPGQQPLLQEGPPPRPLPSLQTTPRQSEREGEFSQLGPSYPRPVHSSSLDRAAILSLPDTPGTYLASALCGHGTQRSRGQARPAWGRRPALPRRQLVCPCP